MYSNAGQSIKKYVEIVCRICYALVGIGAGLILIVGFATSPTPVAGLISIIIAALVAALGFLSIWISGLMLYAYGEITDRLINIDVTLAKMNKPEDDAPSVVSPARPVPAPVPHCPNPTGPSWTCSCGRVHAPYVSTCPCGVNKRDLQE